MKIPLSWLRELAPNDASLDELFAVLSELGLPVESVTPIGEDLTGVVVAKVLEVHRIEGADKIRRIIVDDGLDAPTQVVCGAWNFDVGATVPFARVGTVLPGDFTEESGYQAGKQALAMVPRPDAIFAANDMMAIGCLSALSEAQVRTPQDIAVVGFDDIPMARYVTPSLTTVRIRIAELGEAALERLVQMIEPSDDEAPRPRAVVGTELVVRASCGGSDMARRRA